MEVNNIDDLSSDHSAIVLTLSDTILHKQAVPKLTNKFTDWEAFRNGVNQKVNLHVRLKSPANLWMQSIFHQATTARV